MSKDDSAEPAPSLVFVELTRGQRWGSGVFSAVLTGAGFYATGVAGHDGIASATIVAGGLGAGLLCIIGKVPDSIKYRDMQLRIGTQVRRAVEDVVEELPRAQREALVSQASSVVEQLPSAGRLPKRFPGNSPNVTVRPESVTPHPRNLASDVASRGLVLEQHVGAILRRIGSNEASVAWTDSPTDFRMDYSNGSDVLVQVSISDPDEVDRRILIDKISNGQSSRRTLVLVSEERTRALSLQGGEVVNEYVANGYPSYPLLNGLMQRIGNK